MKILVIDAQGGGIGKQIVAAISLSVPALLQLSDRPVGKTGFF